MKIQLEIPQPLADQMTRKEIRDMGYEVYLKSDWWLWRRNSFLDAKGRSCMACTSEENLTVHHATYKKIGAERDGDLRVLCWPCHSNVHDLHRKVKQDRGLATIQLMTATKLIIENGGRMVAVPGDFKRKQRKKKKTKKKTKKEIAVNRKAARAKQRRKKLAAMTEATVTASTAGPVMSKTGRERGQR